MRSETGDMDHLELLGGRLCLDFTNTVDRSARGERRHEYLIAYPDLVAWGRHSGVLTRNESERLLEEAKHRPEEAAAVFGRALALRDAVQEVFYAVVAGQDPPARGLDKVEEEFREALAHSRIVRGEDGFGWVSRGGPGELGRVLWPVACSAHELLISSTSSELERVHRCPGDDGCCGWLFVDSTKNGTRKWCSMAGCGSRAKMKRLYRRRQGAESPADTQAQPPEEG